MTTIYHLTEFDTMSGEGLTDELYRDLEPALAAGIELIHEYFEDDTIEVTWSLSDTGTYSWTDQDMVVQIRPRQAR